MQDDKNRTASRYLEEIGYLRESMSNNFDDNESADAGTRFRYFVDANIVASYIDPAAKIQHLAPLRDWLDDKLSIATATLLMEFVFSGKLPGQEAAHLYLTPAHFEEVERMAQAIAGRGRRSAMRHGTEEHGISRQWLRREDRQQTAIAHIQRIEEQLAQKQCTPAHAVSEIKNVTSDLFETPEAMKALEELGLLERLLVHDRIVHAESYGWFHAAILSPDGEQLNWLVEKLAFIRKQRGGRTETALADAMSLLQLMCLEAECPPDVRHVLITADESLHDLYNAYYEHERSEGRFPPLLTLRRLREYVPLINMKSMSDLVPLPVDTDRASRERIKEERADIFFKMEVALGISDPTSKRHAKDKAWPAEKNFADRDWREHRADVIGLWQQAVTYTILLNLPLLIERQEHLREIIERLLKHGDVWQELLGLLGQTINKIRVLHLVAAIRSTIPGRAPLFFKRNLFSDFIGGDQIEEYVDKLARREVAVDYDKLADPNKEDRALLFTACVALMAGKWDWSRDAAERAIEKFDKLHDGGGEFGYEARYCLAMALRFTLRDKRDYERARELLQSCIEEHRDKKGQSFRLLRALAEAAALTGTFLFAYHWNKNFTKLLPEHEERLMDDWLLLIESAKEVLDERQGHGHEFGDQRIGLQIFSNEASLVLYKKIIARRPTVSSQDVLHHDWQELMSRIEVWKRARQECGSEAVVPGSVTIPAALLGVVVAKSPEERLGMFADAQRQLTAFLAGQLVEMDRGEFSLFQRCLDSLA
jgi:hypothetical protein